MHKAEVMGDEKCCILAVWQSERAALTDLLHRAGLRVQHANKGIEVLHWLEDHSDTPCDLIIADMNLPDMSIWELLKELSEIMDVSHLPTVVFMPRPIVVPFNNVTALVSPVPEKQLRHVLTHLLEK